MERARRLAILAEGMLGFHYGKTAVSILRYSPQDVVAVIDSANTGKTTEEVLGLGGDVPVVADIDDTYRFHPNALLLGVATRGGGFPDSWRTQILSAIEHGLDVISGLHIMLNEDSEFVAAAQQHGVRLHDVRKPPEGLGVAELRPRRHGSKVITFVGSDCAVGKMTAALEIRKAAVQMGLDAGFVATGQTGIMLEASGIAIDRVIGDFMAGATEKLTVAEAEQHEWVFVEGQGSLLHPGYSGVTLALLHGSAPDGMILVHPPTHTEIDDYPVAIPSLTRLIQIYEDAASWVRPAKVLAIALNTRDMDDAAARQAIAEAREETGLPVTDPVRYDASELVRGLKSAFEEAGAASR
jgi:uncharacterized NAD-dependent epimerase/dehydratase family protein